MQLVSRPADFDVLLTENMFGDILSDEAAMLTGSLGMLPSASLGDGRGRACSSPCTARRPTSSGTGTANPLAMFGSVALMLRHGLARENEASALESAIDRALGDGLRTPDLGGDAATEAATRAVARKPLGAVREHRGPHLAERGVRRLGGREGTRTHARPALRDRGVRGHPRLRDRARHRDLPPPGPPATDSRTRLELYYMDLPFSQRADPRGHARADRPATASRAATSGRWSTAATARWASTRSTTRSRRWWPSGSGAPTWARRASRTACGRGSPPTGASPPTR